METLTLRSIVFGFWYVKSNTSQLIEQKLKFNINAFGSWHV